MTQEKSDFKERDRKLQFPLVVWHYSHLFLVHLIKRLFAFSFPCPSKTLSSAGGYTCYKSIPIGFSFLSSSSSSSSIVLLLLLYFLRYHLLQMAQQGISLSLSLGPSFTLFKFYFVGIILGLC